MSGPWVLAHQGGWDEILLVLTPVAMFAGLLWLANRRADAQLEGRSVEDGDPADEGAPDTGLPDAGPPGGDPSDGDPSAPGPAGGGPSEATGPPSEVDGPPGGRSP